MTSYFKRHPYHIIRAIRSIGSIAMHATYFYMAQFLALVITLSAIGGTNGALLEQQIDISVLKSVNVIFLGFVAGMIVSYILTLIWNTFGGRRSVTFPIGPVFGIGLVHLLRYLGVYTIYSTGNAAAITALGLILIQLFSRVVVTLVEKKVLASADQTTVELNGDTFTIYTLPDSREFMVIRSVESTGYSVELHPNSPVARAIEEIKTEIDRREALMEEMGASEVEEKSTPAPVPNKETVEEQVQEVAKEQILEAPSVIELRDTYASIIRKKQDKPAKHLGATVKRKNLKRSGRKLTAHELTAHEPKLQSRIRNGRRHK